MGSGSDERRADQLIASAHRKNVRAVDAFNERMPIGTPVLYWPGDRTGEGRKSRTRSKAWNLGSHTPVVLVEGYPGGIAISHVVGIEPEAGDQR